ncbi:hypothetical protein RND64_07605 [Gordonia sp. w5E2]|nr:MULTISPECIES: hypothetical protein [Gordonia]OBC16092.1 hypothetical protein A5788_13970 [Gordonia sp. 852002-50816_SCH5313054-c]OBC17256.1 hypothetical protein A5786_19125 [Gordonia sp. 852002-50816_SCH5313054-a]SLA00809.1 protein kinase [Mycobacteroides abscessus subsp. abscessus]
MTYPQQPPQRSPWSSPAVIIAIATGILLVVGVVLAALILLPRLEGDDSNSAAASSSPAPTSGAPGNVGPATTTAGSGGAQNGTRPPEIQNKNPQNNGTQDTDSPTTPHATPDISGTDWQGFTAGPRCNAADDPAMVIAATNRSQIVICQVGSQAGRWYYKGYAEGNSVEVGYPTRSGDTYRATNGNVTYVVGPSQLDIEKNGETIATEPMNAYWTAS